MESDLEPLVSEVWRPVSGYTGYEVSSFGRVSSFWGAGVKSERNRRTCGQGRRTLTTNRKIIGGYENRSGHKTAVLYKDGESKPKTVGVHVLVLEAFVGPRPPKMEACHYPDRDPANNRLDNLRWGTRSHNQIYMLSHGTHRHAKLTEADIPVIWERLRRDDSLASIARDYGVSDGAISRIKTGEGFEHITKDLPGYPLVLPDARNAVSPSKESVENEIWQYLDDTNTFRVSSWGRVQTRWTRRSETGSTAPANPSDESEVWKILEEWPAYRVSSWGNVQSRWERVIGGGRGEFRLGDEWTPKKLSLSTDGYLGFTISNDSHSRRMNVHQVILEAFAGPRPAGLKGQHIDGNRLNNRSDNLRWHKETQSSYALGNEWVDLPVAQDRDGYARVSIARGGKKDGLSKWANVHALVLTAFAGPRPQGMHACHGDGNRQNNRADNLRWDTARANVQDRWSHAKKKATHS